MFTPDGDSYPSRTDEEREKFQLALAEEAAAKESNIAAAMIIAPVVVEACEKAVAIVQQLREQIKGASDGP